MAQIQASNNYDSTLASSINPTDTSLIVNSVTGAPALDVTGDYFMLTLISVAGDIEIVKVTAVDIGNNTFTVERAQEGTAGLSFAVDSKVSHRFTAGAHKEFLTNWFFRNGNTYVRTDATHITVTGVMTDYDDNRAIRIIDDGGTAYNMYIVGTVGQVIEVSETLPATVAMLELGPDVDWLPQQSNASTADYATTAGSATTATSATTADSITGKTINTISGGAADVIPVTSAGGTIDSSFLPTHAALDISFNNTASGLSATNVQSAIDEVDSNVDSKPSTDTANTWTKSQTVGIQTLVDTANVAWDASLGNVAKLTLTADRVLSNPTNLVAGGTYILVVDGGFNLTYGNVYAWREAAPPTITGKTVLSFVYDGTVMLGVGTPDVRVS